SLLKHTQHTPRGPADGGASWCFPHLYSAADPVFQLPQGDLVGLPLVGKNGQRLRQLPALGGEEPADDEVQEVRVLHQRRAGDVGGQHVAAGVALSPALLVVAEAQGQGGEERGGDAVGQAALVHKAHGGGLPQGGGGDHVPGGSLVGLHGGEVRQGQALPHLAGGVGDGGPQGLHGAAGEEEEGAPVHGGLQLAGVGDQPQEGGLLGPLGAGAHVDH